MLFLVPLTAAATFSAWADGVQAVATVAALIAAGFAWHESHKLNDREAERDGRQAERDRRQEQDRRREGQAAHINVWPEWRDTAPFNPDAPDVRWTTAARVSNTSQLPLYDATLFMGWPAGHGVVVGVRLLVELIRPGDSVLISMPDHAYQYAFSSGAFTADQLSSDEWPPSQIPPIHVALQFTDLLGTVWFRDASGALVPTADPSGTFSTNADPLRAWSIIPPPPASPPPTSHPNAASGQARVR